MGRPQEASRQWQTRASRRDLVAQLSGPLRTFLHTEVAGALAMLAATVAALVWANSPWEAGYRWLQQLPLSASVGSLTVTTSVTQALNDGLLALFFFVIGLEVRREVALGELTDHRRALLPGVAGLAGMAAPVALFLWLAPTGAGARAWGVVIGTDTAFLLGALALVGPRVSTQLRVFLLTVTVVDDLVAVVVVGVVYSGRVHASMLALVAASAAGLLTLDRLEVRRVGPHVLLAASLWAATVSSGLHGSLGGMVAGLSIAASAPRRDVVEGTAHDLRAFRQSPMVSAGRSVQRAVAHALSVNERLQAALHPWTSLLVVPAFAFVNAGVDLRGGNLERALLSPLTWAVVVGLVLGKPMGVAGAALLGQRAGWGSLPHGVEGGHVLGGAALAGIGFTVSLLVVGLALPDPDLRSEATVGVLVAAVVSILAGKALFWLAASLGGVGDAGLPTVLDRPVEAGVDHILGATDAAMTLVEYADFECPFCARATGVTADLRARFGRDLRYVFRHLPLTAVHPHAELAARAAVAADQQGRFWPMHDMLFAHQDQLDLEDLLGYARALDLDVERFALALHDPDVGSRIMADVASAEASGARGTPTFFVGDRRHVGPFDAESLAAALLVAFERHHDR